jgi:hypothetical protein
MTTTTAAINRTYELLDLSAEQQELINRVAVLRARSSLLAPLNTTSTATFPAEDFDDLFHAGLHAPVVPKEHGGLGLGPYTGDVFTLWMMTKEIARADLSLARCWEGHVNSLVLLDGMSTEEQKARWFKGVVERGEKWVAWSGEPQARKPGEPVRFGTTVEKVDGGYLIEWEQSLCDQRRRRAVGHPAGEYCRAGRRASRGCSNARHATHDGVQPFRSDVEIDTSWWDPIGMRATVSHLVHFRRTFIPE